MGAEVSRLEIFSHSVLIGFSGLLINQAVTKGTLISRHPACMITAALLWTESIILFRKPKPNLRVNTHWAINASALALAGFGVAAIYQHKEMKMEPHLKSLHGICGAATLALLGLQTVGGNVANFSLQIKNFVLSINSAKIKKVHRFIGGGALVAIWLTIGAALKSPVIIPLSLPCVFAITNAKFK